MFDDRSRDPQPAQVSTEASDTPSLAHHAPELTHPVQAILRTLARISARGEELAPSQRGMLAALTAEVEAVERRIQQLLNPPRPVAAPERSLLASTELAKVLLVDDDLVWLDAAKDLLERDFRVLVAADGFDASEVMIRERPDVVITDLTMPRTGGLALLEILKAHEDTADIPLIVLSGHGDTETKIKAFELGAADYLTKPVALAELVARARNAIAGAQTLRRERLLQETDDLTGLSNRRALRNILTSAIRYSAASHKALTVAMVDQDGLKQINDRYGHAAGDVAIQAISRALTTCKRASDTAARYGGDEFCVVMPGTDRAGAERFVARVHEELAKNPIHVGGETLVVGASFGLASLAEVAWEETWDELIARADHALYLQKSARRAERLANAAEAFFRAWKPDPNDPGAVAPEAEPTPRVDPT